MSYLQGMSTKVPSTQYHVCSRQTGRGSLRIVVHCMKWLAFVVRESRLTRRPCLWHISVFLIWPLKTDFVLSKLTHQFITSIQIILLNMA